MGDAAPGVAGFPPPGNGDPAPTPSRAPVGSRRQAPRDLLVHRTLGGNLVRGCSQGDDRGSAASPVGANGALRRRATDVRRLKVEVGMLRAMLHLLLNSFTRQLVFQSLFPHMILPPIVTVSPCYRIKLQSLYTCRGRAALPMDESCDETNTEWCN
jgi:hypothetical protein